MFGSYRWSNGSKMQNIEPKFEPLALSSSDWPVTAWVKRMPGVSLAIRSHLSSTSLVFSSETESGSWTLARR